MTRAQLEQQARDLATEAVVGDFIAFQVPGDVTRKLVPRMTRAQLQQQARDFATEAVVGDFIAFQVPGDVNIAYVVGKVDSGLAVLEHTTNTLGGNVQDGTDDLWFKQMRAVQPEVAWSLALWMAPPTLWTSEISSVFELLCSQSMQDFVLEQQSDTGCSPKNNKES